jgi:glycosyltransferase involved in cell wall biosynthesis
MRKLHAMTSKVDMVSVVIPTLNEAGNILEALLTIEKELAYPNEVIVVDGDSTDGTKEIVKDNNCKLIIQKRRGYGIALRTGMRYAKGDIVVMVDGDGTYEVKHINRLIETMIKRDAEMCLATRMYGLSKNSMGVLNYFGNKLITLFFDFLYGQYLTDTQSGFRAISRSAIEKVNFGEGDMAFATEMLVKFAKKGFRMVEVPTVYKPRKYGKTKLKRFSAGMQIFNTIFKGLRE